jgi:predicted DNA-binding transcriptional regulator
MKEININIYKAWCILLAPTMTIALITLTGCASPKGPKQVWASPVERVVSPVNQAITDAPRTQPGKIMDPDAVTYAQVPSRIIYLPGGQGIKSRQSPRQEVAYNLVPVSRIGAIQAEGTPEFGEIIVQGGDKTTVDIAEMTIISDGGETLRGKGRRLGILGRTESAKSRAKDLLKKGEQLEWDTERGWVGFVVETRARPYTPKKVEEPKISEVKDTPKKEKPEIEDISKSKTKVEEKGDDEEEEEDFLLDLNTSSGGEEIELLFD